MPGSIATDVTIAFDDGTPDSSFSLHSGCDDGFATDAGIWLANYSGDAQARENGYGAISYSQYQEVTGYDIRDYMQGNPVEVARFVALLDRYGIEPFGYRSTADPGCAGGTATAVRALRHRPPRSACHRADGDHRLRFERRLRPRGH